MISITVPIKTGRGLNDRICWQARARKVKGERVAVHWWWARAEKKPLLFPVEVLLIRQKPSGRLLDDDNLRGSLKGVRDQVSKELGVDDGDGGKIRFEYGQEKGPWGVRIEIR